MHGIDYAPSPQAVRMLWDAYYKARTADGRSGFENRPQATGFIESGVSVYAYVNVGRWVADCPFCKGGIACWSEMPDGACYDCGRIHTIVFPDAEVMAQGEEILSFRPGDHDKNWFPQVETVDDLKAENAARGVDFTKKKEKDS